MKESKNKNAFYQASLDDNLDKEMLKELELEDGSVYKKLKHYHNVDLKDKNRFFMALTNYEVSSNSPSDAFRKNLFLKVAIAAILILSGFFLGKHSPHLGTTKVKSDLKLSQLEQELDALKSQLIQTNLQHDSPTDRILAVQQTSEFSVLNDHLLEQLLYTLNTDRNVNVRLAASNVLFQFVHSDKAKTALIESINEQDQYPLVQVILINGMFELKEKRAYAAIEKVLQKNLLPEIDQRKFQKELTLQNKQL